MEGVLCALFAHVSVVVARIPYHGLGGVCPQRFVETHDATLFENYCTLWLLHLDRVPEHLREDICYSKCLTSETCLFHVFSYESQECVLCVRNLERVDIASVGSRVSQLARNIVEGVAIQSRIGIVDTIQNKNMVTLNCTSEMFGFVHANNPTEAIDIPPSSQITFLHFCTDSTGKLNGFTIEIGDINRTALCTANPVG